MTEDEAQAAVDAAGSAYDTARAVMNKEIATAKAEIQARHADAISAVAQVFRDAREVLRIAKDAVADYPWAGKRVFKMAPGSYSWDRNPRMVRVEGLVETMRSTTELPGNASRWNRPPIGSPIVRLLKKDGTPGLKFETMREHSGWKLADEAPQ